MLNYPLNRCLRACRKPNDYSNNPDRKITTRFLGSPGTQTRRLSRKLCESLCSFTTLHLMLLVSCKAAMTAHPDKGGSEAKMAQVNEAYEPLSNPGKQRCTINTLVLLAQLIFTELRQRFDDGDDPNDPGSSGGRSVHRIWESVWWWRWRPYVCAVFPAGWAARVVVW
jgi:hypothetical protein